MYVQKLWRLILWLLCCAGTGLPMSQIVHANERVMPSALVSNHEFSASDQIILEQNTAEIVHIRDDVSQIFVANPEIADIQLNTASVGYVFGKQVGTTTIFGTNKNGKRVFQLELQVIHNLKQLNQILASVVPGEQVRAYSAPSGIILDGTVSSPLVANTIVKIASRFVGQGATTMSSPGADSSAGGSDSGGAGSGAGALLSGAGGGSDSSAASSSGADGAAQKIVNNLKIATPTQVYLKVKIASVNRDMVHTLGVNWSSTLKLLNERLTLGVVSGRALTTAGAISNPGGTSQAGTMGAVFNDSPTDITAFLDALSTEGLATLLAEPNLVCLSGESASFLVGGEIPVQTVTENNGTSVEFKPFGVSLSFSPRVLSSNLINLRVRPEISSLGDAGVGGNPTVQTSRAETSVELGSGQSLAIAGLFSRQISNKIKSLPGLGDLPVLGAFFRQTEYARKEQELVIIVTPYLVKPTSRDDLSLPTETIHYASHLEQILLGKLNRVDTTGRLRQELSRRDVHLVGAAGFYVH